MEALRKRWTTTPGSRDSGQQSSKRTIAGHFSQPATGGSGPRVDGKEGVAGSSPAEGFRNRATARFSRFRIGSTDHFLCQWKGSPFFEPRRGSP